MLAQHSQATAATEVEVEEAISHAPNTHDPQAEKDSSSKTKNKTDAKSKTKRQPPYAVILHNDDLNGMDHVVSVLRKVFHYSRTKCIWLMMKAHVSGRSVVWSGSLEVAELKAEQLKSCGPDPNMKDRGALTLRVTVEPLP